MVDPNRKINRLAEENVAFLEECEAEFALRYTADDTEFMEHCRKPVPEPPILENWVSAGGVGGGDGGRSNYSNQYQYANKNYSNRRREDRGWQRRGGTYNNSYADHGHGNKFYRKNEYANRRYRGGGGDERNYVRRTEHRSGPPMEYRRDYGNFVPASRD